ncbi:hypothetical protein CLOM_g19714 [Closterium sp. NIES-68]|nr:hypothetical protein CLOM_g19714 [Closterium sp. NIES-68]
MDAMWTFNSITATSPPARRLSLRHGASAAEIKAHMKDLFHELETTRLAGFPLSANGWRRRTAGAPRLQDCYKLGRELGRGHFGVVRECVDAGTGELFACKSILKDQIQRPEDLKELSAEVLVPLLLQGGGAAAGGAGKATPGAGGILRLFEIAEDESALHLVVEHCAGGDLFDHVARNTRLPEREAAGIFRQVVSVVLRMHARGIVHRDLKPENIFLRRPPSAGCASATLASASAASPPTTAAVDARADATSAECCAEVRVGDFGLAQQLTRERPRLRGLAGSPFYMAPEIVRGKEYGAEVDVWSLGVVLYTCLSGVLPFYGKNHNAIFAAACRADPDMSKRPWSLISTEAKHLVRSMLQADPTRRIRLHDVLYHPWLRIAGRQSVYRSLLQREIASLFPATVSVSPMSKAAAMSAPKSAPIPIPVTGPTTLKAAVIGAAVNSTISNPVTVTSATTTCNPPDCNDSSSTASSSPGSSGSSFSITLSTSISSSRSTSSSSSSNCSNMANSTVPPVPLFIRQNTIKVPSAAWAAFPPSALPAPLTPPSLAPPLTPSSAVVASIGNTSSWSVWDGLPLTSFLQSAVPTQ